MTSERETPWCCIDKCDKDADWNIWNESEHPTEGTQSCSDHVGLMLMDGTNHVWPVE